MGFTAFVLGFQALPFLWYTVSGISVRSTGWYTNICLF